MKGNEPSFFFSFFGLWMCEVMKSGTLTVMWNHEGKAKKITEKLTLIRARKLCTFDFLSEVRNLYYLRILLLAA